MVEMLPHLVPLVVFCILSDVINLSQLFII